MSITAMESEVLCLRAATGSIDEMVNYSLFHVTEANPESVVLFHNEIHQRLFNILLVDLLNPMDPALSGPNRSVLDGLGSICHSPQFSKSGSIGHLKPPLSLLSEWLDQEVTVSVHLSRLNRETDLVLRRREFLEICGNISKHNFTRLTRTAARLRKIMMRNGINLAELDDLLILEDFYGRFHSDVLNYHATAIIEMLNNVRWGIHKYLWPEYERSFTPDGHDPLRYSYKYPTDIISPASRAWYWELMNDIRSGPPVRTFTGSRWLKSRY